MKVSHFVSRAQNQSREYSKVGRQLKEHTMKMQVFIFLVLVTSQAALAQQNCQDVFDLEQTILDRKELAEVDLSKLYDQETAGKTADDVAEMNKEMLESIEGEVPVKETSDGMISITETAAARLIQLTLENPVASPGNEKYSQPDVSIGYCFGRATFVHLMLLKMGVQKNSIRKIWAVGPMKAGGIMWQFHVATAVYTPTKGWLIIDTNHSAPMPVRDWMAYYGKQSSPEGMVRFYATDASKFAFQLGKYSPIQLGLDLSADKDWYRHYFKDMMEWLQTKEVSEDAVVTEAEAEEVRKDIQKEDTMTISSLWTSIVEFVEETF